MCPLQSQCQDRLSIKPISFHSLTAVDVCRWSVQSAAHVQSGLRQSDAMSVKGGSQSGYVASENLIGSVDSSLYRWSLSEGVKCLFLISIAKHTRGTE